MDRKAVLEVRKLFDKNDCRIDRMRGCYVNGEKELRDVAVADTVIVERKKKGMPPAQKRAADAQREAREKEKKDGEATPPAREGRARGGKRGGQQRDRVQEKKK